jgi:LuxR family transcriptional regulator, maltose regulon positive regulatory protein
MPVQILSTKLSIPPIRSRLVRRNRLIQKLNQGLEYGLVLVSAPAGYGKSSLLSAWLSQVEIPAAWLTLDVGDNDPPRFLTYLATALAGVAPSIAEVFDRTQNFRVQPEVDLLLTPLINHLAQLKRPIYLILDDFHLIHDQTVHQVMNFLLDHRPAPLHLVIATRADPPLPLAKLRARSELLELRLTDLRFTNKEAADFLNRTMGLQISSTEVDTITIRTEGWIAGLQIAALSMQNIEDVSGFITSLAGSDYYIFDYLTKEILARQSPDIHQFLLYTAILAQLTAPLCDALLDAEVESVPMPPATVILEELEHANLFLIPLDHEHRWFRYHHLFSDMLRLILEQTYPGLSTELHLRACRWYESQGMIPEALEHAISSGDMQLVAQLISANVLVLLENDEVIPTLQKIDTIPHDEMIVLPWLGIARAWIMGASQIQESLQLLDEIDQVVENVPDTDERRRLRGYIAAARAFLFNAQGDPINIISNAKLADELLPVDDFGVRAMNLNIWASGYTFDVKNYSVAIPILEQALTLALQAKKMHVAAIIATHLASIQQNLGKLKECHRICIDALAIAEEYEKQNKRPLSATGQIYSITARNLAEWGELDKALQHARKGLQLCEQWGLAVAITGSLQVLGRILVFCQEYDQARQIFLLSDKLAQKISTWYWQETALYNLESSLYSDASDDEIAQQVHRLQESGIQFPALFTARSLIRNKQPGEALLVLEHTLSDLMGQSSFKSVRIYAMRAIAFQAQGDEKQALISLQQALELGEPENRVASFVCEGEAMEKLLRQANIKDLHPQFVRRLLAAFEARSKPKPEPDHVDERLIEPLSEREIQVLRLLGQGYTDKQIAATLIVTNQTVHQHLKNIYSKLDVHSRTEANVRAQKLGLL